MRAPSKSQAHASWVKSWHRPTARPGQAMPSAMAMAMPLAWPEVVPWFYLAAAHLSSYEGEQGKWP